MSDLALIAPWSMTGMSIGLSTDLKVSKDNSYWSVQMQEGAIPRKAGSGRFPIADNYMFRFGTDLGGGRVMGA